MRAFRRAMLPGRVVFGAGAAKTLESEVDGQRVLVLGAAGGIV